MKRKKKNMMAQVMAWLALFAIVIGIVGTWLLVMFSWWDSHSQAGGENVQNLSQEDLQRIIQESQTTVEGQEIQVGNPEVNITATWAAQ